MREYTNRIVKAWCEDYNNSLTSDIDRLEWYDISTIITWDPSGSMKKMIFKFETTWYGEPYQTIEKEIDFDMYIRDLKIEDTLL